MLIAEDVSANAKVACKECCLIEFLVLEDYCSTINGVRKSNCLEGEDGDIGTKVASYVAFVLCAESLNAIVNHGNAEFTSDGIDLIDMTNITTEMIVEDEFRVRGYRFAYAIRTESTSLWVNVCPLHVQAKGVERLIGSKARHGRRDNLIPRFESKHS